MMKLDEVTGRIVSDQVCTYDCKTMTWSAELDIYVCAGCKLPIIKK